MLGSPAAQAQSWTVLSAAQARLEVNDNPALLPSDAKTGGERLSTSTVSASLKSARSTETEVSRADLELVATPGAGGDLGRRINGSLGLNHAAQGPRESWGAGLNLRQEQTGGTKAPASEVPLGRGTRDSGEAELSGAYAFSETLGAQTRWAASRTRFRAAAAAATAAPAATSTEAVNASAFDQQSISLGLNQRINETSTQGLTLSRTQSNRGGQSSTRVTGLQWSGSTQWNETAALTVSLGLSAVQRQQQLQRRVCPVPVSLCNGGLVAFISVPFEVQERSTETQFSTAWSQRLDEITGLSANASRALTPSAFGVAREDTLNLTLNRSFDDNFSGALTLAESRSTFAAASGRAASRLRSLSLSVSRAWSPELNFSAQLQRREYDEGQARGRGRGVSNQVSISLQYQGPRLLDRP
jgi:hypothetical protein